jgi:hypothetical protein
MKIKSNWDLFSREEIENSVFNYYAQNRHGIKTTRKEGAPYLQFSVDWQNMHIEGLAAEEYTGRLVPSDVFDKLWNDLRKAALSVALDILEGTESTADAVVDVIMDNFIKYFNPNKTKEFRFIKYIARKKAITVIKSPRKYIHQPMKNGIERTEYDSRANDNDFTSESDNFNIYNGEDDIHSTSVELEINEINPLFLEIFEKYYVDTTNKEYQNGEKLSKFSKENLDYLKPILRYLVFTGKIETLHGFYIGNTKKKQTILFPSHPFQDKWSILSEISFDRF